MANLTATQLNSIIDTLCQGYVCALGDSTSNHGLGPNAGSYGMAAQVTSLQTKVAAMNDISIESALAPLAKSMGTVVDAATYAGGVYSSFLAAVQNFVTSFSLSGVTSLDAYLTYLNVGGGGTWLALAPPSWQALASAWQRGNTPSIWNLYFEVLAGGVYPNGLGTISHGGSFTAGFAIDTTNYAGGFPELLIAGLTGTDLVTVTGTAFNPATKATATGVTWTVTASANGTVALNPGTAPANSLIAAVSGISLGSGITAGTFTVEAARPAGRPLIS